MAPSNIPMRQSLSPIQLYRRLLRECSYLPPSVRSTIQDRVRHRFHRSKEDQRPSKRLGRALNGLQTLRAANTGEKSAMMNVMQVAFGREGFRRRSIMRTFVQQRGSGNSQSVEAAMDATMRADSAMKKEIETVAAEIGKKRKKPLKDSFYLRWDTEKVKGILVSQKKQQQDTHHATSWRSTIRNLNPDQYVPERTTWGRPPVPRLVMSKRARWWRANAEKIAPPLGKGEWELLGKLAHGAQETEEWKLPSRRQPATPVIEDADNTYHTRALLDYATKRVAHVESRSKNDKVRWTGRKDSGPYARGQDDRTLSARWYQRAYSRIWLTTPTTQQDPNTLQYSFTWGSRAPKIAESTPLQRAVFAGVDNNGSIESPKK